MDFHSASLKFSNSSDPKHGTHSNICCKKISVSDADLTQIIITFDAGQKTHGFQRVKRADFQTNPLFIYHQISGYRGIILTISMCDNLKIKSNFKFIRRQSHSIILIKVFVGFELA